jgi:PfaB family protein
LAIAGIGPEQVEYVDLTLSASGAQAGQELSELTSVWSAERLGTCHTAIGWSATCGGDGARPDILLSLIKTSLCLHYSYLPAWAGPEWVEKLLLDRSAFYVADESRPWIRRSPQRPLYAVISVIGEFGRHVHLTLAGASLRGEVVSTDWTRAHGPALLPVGAPDIGGLALQIMRAREELRKGADYRRLTRSAPAAWADSPVRAVFCADSPETMRRDLQAGLTQLSVPSPLNRDWLTPAGSCYSPSPIGPDGRVALVFPGMLTAYPGLGADLCRCFPGLIPLAEEHGDRIARLVRADWLYPRRSSMIDKDHPGPAEAEVLDNIPSVAETCASYAIALAQVLRHLLGLTVHGALGYSLGEISMICALGQRAPFDGDKPVRHDDMFQDWLGGRKRAVRELWRIPDQRPEKAVWATRMLFADAAAVREQVEQHDRVYLTHINTQNEVLIAGDPGQCRAVVRALDCPSIPSRLSYVLHCPVPEAAQLAEHLRGQIPAISRPIDGMELFSTCDYDQIDTFDASGITKHIAEALRTTVDFPRLVQVAYQRGYRYFVEVGPGRTCTRWIGEILTDRPHVAISVDRRGFSTGASVARAVSRLTAHGLTMRLPGLST